ncbi:penicillin-binding protein 1C [Leisingera sp. HS039]|uniref:penicillin-binding protein 1C n=1 Tax=unclassified Leisingera TaxID=2614906 RepID=UPI001070B753|nr:MULTISPECIES: penicillin-binding protein 1C [unclassified Leisingera]MBQ4824002.1 penicillin-binding protein 1C [Leisingera sp. HS039]QBR38281.1 penicillin-binding protein 1C [Leisingera sp. NJS201]
MLAAAFTAWRSFDAWIDATDLPLTLAETSTEVLGRNGKLLRAYPVGTGLWRLAVQPEDVDPRFLDMLLRYEDKRFRSHAGVDPIALLRAAGQALWNGRAVSGGSTLTMQVARLLEDGTTGRWAGKLRQMRVALALERRLSKDGILTLYLTHAPYGGAAEGIRAAAYSWFGKEPRRLTPAEAALLVALPQSPERRRPDRFPEAASEARDRVLARMQRQGLLSEEQAEAARRTPLPHQMAAFPRLAPHLADRVKAQHPGKRQIRLTIDSVVQSRMQQLLAEAARSATPSLSAALIAADHQTGEVLVLVGSPGYSDAQRRGFVDMTQAIRSPGSTLKPLIYGLAFDQGLAHPETLIHDGPVNFAGYAPQNFDGEFRGDIRLRKALQLSLNIPVVKLTQELGPARVLASLRAGGAKPELPGGAPGLALSLGGLGISLQDMVQLYAGLAASGQGPALRMLQGEAPAPAGRLTSPEAAWQVADILRGLPVPAGARSGTIAYKTGTSYGHRDAWAIGWDGRHVIGVWMGRADGTPVPGIFGGDLAAPVLFEAFGRLKPALDPLPPPPPATLIVSSAELPQPLQRFRPRDAAFSEPADAPELIFPPEGARLMLEGADLTLKLRGGTAPFLVMANGLPVLTGQRRREFSLPSPGPGFSSLVIVDGEGRSDRVDLRID